MMQTGEIIMDALGLFRERGWCKGILQDEQGRLCAVGAVCTVLSGSAFDYGRHFVEYKAAMDALWRHIPQDVVCERVGVAHYNNTRKSFEEIEEWFEKAAADERISE